MPAHQTQRTPNRAVYCRDVPRRDRSRAAEGRHTGAAPRRRLRP